MRKITITDEKAVKEMLPSGSEDVVLMRDGHAVALVTAFDDDDMEWYAQEHDPAFIESLRAEREKIAAGQTITHEELVRRLGVRPTKELLTELVNENEALGVEAAERQLRDERDEPGFYAIFVDDPQSLPDFIAERLREQQTKLIYVGIASRSLRLRLIEQDLRHKKPSTFFRTLGAVLDYKPPSGSLNGKANQYNYRFCAEDTRSITEWINAHLRIKWLEAHLDEAELRAAEKAMIRTWCPAFNLDDNPQKIKRIEELRERCRRIALGADAA